jgi:hypothetical protein
MRTRHLEKPGEMGSGQEFCPSAKRASRPADRRGWMSFRPCLVWISLFLVLWASAGLAADPQDQMAELTRKMAVLQKQFEAAQGDPNRLMGLAKEMQDLSAQVVKLQAQMAGKSSAWASSEITSAQGKAHPWLVATPHGYLARPVRVTVYNRMEEATFGRIYTGILPETGEEFVRSYLLFDYTAKAEGAFLYKGDYSEYRMDAPGDKTSVNIQALTGYAQRQVQGQKLEHEGYALGAASIVRPVHLSLFHPITDTKNVTNLHFVSLEAQTSDERMPSVTGSSFPNLSVNLDLEERFIVTPQLMEAFVEQGRLDKTFAWRTFQPNGKDYVDNLVRIQIEIGEEPEEQPGILAVGPKEGFTSSGQTGGQSFTPLSKTYTLRNVGKSAIDFEAANNHNWLALSASHGHLAPGQGSELKVTLTDAAKQLGEGEYKDTLTFTNTTSSKGNTTRAATLLVGAEEQTWRVSLTGMDLDDLGGTMFWMKEAGKIKQVTFDYGVRFNFKLGAEFIIRKVQGKWKYVNGTIIEADVKASSNYDKEVFDVTKVVLKGGAALAALKGAWIGGHLGSGIVQLTWPNKFVGATVYSKLKLAHDSKEQSHKGEGINEFVSEDFIPRAAGHKIPLKDGSFSPDPVKKNSAYYKFSKNKRPAAHVVHNYQLKRIK